jgi:urease accessory protein
MTAESLLRLLVWLSPAFPVGAFAYSHGLEWLIEADDIYDRTSLGAAVADLLVLGGGWNDAVLLAEAYRRVVAGDQVGLNHVAKLALALTGGAERRLETEAMGTAFHRAIQAVWPVSDTVPALTRLEGIGYPIAVGHAAAGHGLALTPVLVGYLHAFAANLISAGVRLIPLGQTDGLRLIAALEPLCSSQAERAAASTLDDLGGACFRAELAAMHHETQYTRLFRT